MKQEDLFPPTVVTRGSRDICGAATAGAQRRIDNGTHDTVIRLLRNGLTMREAREAGITNTAVVEAVADLRILGFVKIVMLTDKKTVIKEIRLTRIGRRALGGRFK
jgi:hypothetical protein